MTEPEHNLRSTASIRVCALSSCDRYSRIRLTGELFQLPVVCAGAHNHPGSALGSRVVTRAPIDLDPWRPAPRAATPKTPGITVSRFRDSRVVVIR